MRLLNYRPEIDGLRALAVLAVVLFHMELRVPGGYVGVDIFFVISGFLITTLIRQALAAGTFSFVEFWERRIRRIVPAATVTVVVSLIIGYFLLLPADFAELGQSAVAQALVGANVFFYRATGYFAGPAESKPLLHFWSLAVEEQFYLVFPLVLVALARWRGRRAIRVVGTSAVLSFALSVVGVRTFPDATFYLLPTRIWELALGALLALNGCRLPLSDRARGSAGWIGVALMVGPMLAYTAETPFPGLAALPPCLGALLVIWATAGDAGEGALKRLLSRRPMVFVGLISYSLYLWHWPVKVFSHYWFTELHSPALMRLTTVGVSVGLAWLSWRFVETPFRRRAARVTPRAVFGVTALAGATVVVCGAVIATREGLPGRFPAATARYAAAYDDRPEMEEADLTTEAAEAGELPELGTVPARPAILLWGDSHARVVSPAVEGMCRELGLNGRRASRSETASLLGWGDEEKQRHNAAVYRWIQRNRPAVVVLASRWEKVLREPADEAALAATVRAIQRTGATVTLMRQVASQRQDIPKALARATLLGEDVRQVGVPVAAHAKFTRRSNDMIDDIARSTRGVRVLDPIPYLSRDGRCLAETAGRALYYDYQHLTRHGARMLTPMFASLMRNLGLAPGSVGR